MGNSQKPEFYLIRKSDFPRFMDSLLRKSRLFAPVRGSGEGVYNFGAIKAGRDIDMKGYINTEFPPKQFFMPDPEVLMSYRGAGKIKAKVAKEKIIIFGIRPCDLHALAVLDRVMLAEPSDARYKKRRDATMTFALNCNEAGENCFCGSMDTCGALGFDLLFTDQDNEFHVEAGSEKGRKMIARSRLFRKTGKAAQKPKLLFRKHLDTRGLEGIMKASFGSHVWEDVASRCLSCASCTSVCPTCYCFGISHVNSLEKPGSGKVVREWDYCMLRPFTRVAGNAVFRERRAERVKQFFYHKLVYGKENQGKFHCVGCGRCITDCMTHIDITEEVAKIRKEYEKRELRA